MIKSPFILKQSFLSPLLCEEIVDNLEFLYPDIDENDKPLKSMRGNDKSQEIIYEYLQDLIPEIENRYGIAYDGTMRMMFEWYPQACKGEEPHCENSDYVRGKWIRTRERDITCVVFMSDYQEKTPFDSDFEVYGGKLEFPQHSFGFNPKRGTLVAFPSTPHFINNTTGIIAGDLYQVRFHIAAKTPYEHVVSEYPGDFRNWFKGLM